MNLRPKKDVCNPNEWLTSSLRLTTFPVDPGSVRDRQWWQEIIGEEPESNIRKKLLSVEQGLRSDLAITLTTDAQKFDCLLAAAVDPQDPPDDMPTIAPFLNAIEKCSNIFEKTIEVTPPMKRLAFGAVLLLPVPSHEVGYTRLGEFLHYLEVDPSSSDLNYRINRKRSGHSVSEGISINRLSTWALLKWSFAVGVSSSIEPIQSAEGFACRLELDINTDAASLRELPREQIGPLWSELVEMGKEIATYGDMA